MFGHIAGWMLLGYSFFGMSRSLPVFEKAGEKLIGGIAGRALGVLFGLVLAVAVIAGAISISTPAK